MKTIFSILSISLASIAFNASAQTYIYDDAGRLEKLLYDNGKGVEYTYDVRDNLTQVKTIAVPPAVTNLSIRAISEAQAELTWDHSGSVLLYLVQSKLTGTDNWVNGGSIDDVNARSTTINLVLEEERAYRLVVLGSGGESSAPSADVLLPSQTPLIVTTWVDENDGTLGYGRGDSLREVIQAANTGETINFASDLTGKTILLNGTELEITEGITIDGSALPERVTIDANNQSRVFSVESSESVLLKGLNMTRGNSSQGGALISRGTILTLEECEVTKSNSVNFGGGIDSSNGSLVLDETTVSGNIANEGGGIASANTALQINHSTISGNSADLGGGLYHMGSTLLVDRSAVFANEATRNGGGLYASGADVSLENSTLSGNASGDDTGGGIFNTDSSDLIARHCTIVENTGTGIVNEAATSLTLDNSIVANNFNTLNAPDDIDGDFTAVAANLVRVHNGSRLSGPAPLTSDPLLSSFGFYGGSSSSMPPLPGSPVLEAGIVTANTPSNDQQNSFRPHGSAPELGSIESRLSSETNLEWITTSAGTIFPTFRSQLTAYAASVPNHMTTVAFRAAATDFTQTIEVRINGGSYSAVASKAPSAELSLNQGDNTVEVRVTAQNVVSKKTYTIIVSRGAPSAENTDLTALSTSTGPLSPNFDAETRTYNAVVANGTSTTAIGATSVNAQATLAIRSNFGSYTPLISGQSSLPLDLHVGKNAIDIEVTAQDGATTTVHSIIVTREAPAESNALLAALSVSAGNLSPTFSRGISAYEIDVSGSVTAITASATTANLSASMQASVNGGAFQNLVSGGTSEQLALDPGANIIEVKVTSQDGTLQTYTLIVTRITESLDWISEAGDGNSTKASMSADCRYVAFASNARNLISGSVNNNTHIYVYDRVLDSMRLLSKSDGGQQGDRNSADPVISADGLFVAFQSEARNLVPNDDNGSNDPSQGRDIFVYDLTEDTIERVSLRDNGGESNQASSKPSISGDGRYVAFVSSANNLVSGFANDEVNVYVYDRTGDEGLKGIAAPFGGFSANRNLLNPSFSADGNYIAFEFSVDKSAEGGDPGYQYRDIYLYGRKTGLIQRITGVLNGSDADGSQSSSPSISADGRYVAFVSNLESLDFYDTNNALDVFVFDRIEGTTRRVSANGSSGGQSFRDSTNPSISGDGNYVAFESMASNLVDNDTNNSIDIFITDLNTGEITLGSVNLDGTQGNQGSLLPSLSYDGRCLAFDSRSSNFHPSDSNSVSDIFVASTDELDPSSVATLATLTSNLGELDISGNTFNANVLHEVDTATLGLYTSDAGATIKASVNGGLFKSQPTNAVSTFTLKPGFNSIAIQVTAADGSTTQNYTLTITRNAVEPSLLNIADLSNLTSSVGSLTPNFASDTLVYTTSVPTETTTATVSPTLTVANASVTVNGESVNSGSASNPIALDVGSNPILVTVTALDGVTKKTYALAITRAADLSSIADLANLTSSVGSLTPNFASDTLEYTASVPTETTTATVSPTLTVAAASVTVNGESVSSGSASNSIALNVGSNPILVTVTALDGVTKKTYVLAITRAADLSSIADLANLTSSVGSLTPNFASDTLEYTASVPTETTTATVSPTLTVAAASVTVNGESVSSGSASNSIALNVGSNPILVTVTALDGVTKKTYVLAITRAADLSSIADLANLTSSVGSLTPNFASDTLEYTASVPTETTTATVSPTLTVAAASVTVNGESVSSGSASNSIALNVGSNPILVTVTALDGVTKKTYVLAITRAADLSSIADLANLTSSVGSLTPNFASDTLEYTASVSAETTTATVSPTLTVAAASVTVNGESVNSGSASNSIALDVGSNEILVTVTAVDGVTKKTYALAITRAAERSININEIQLISGPPTKLRVTWESEPEVNYLIEQSSDLGFWTTLSDNIPSGGSSTTVNIDLAIPAVGKIFFRVSKR